MAIRYDICQDQACIISPSARAWCQAQLATLGEVSRSEDPTGGGLAKAVKAGPPEAPIFVLHGQVPLELGKNDKYPLMGLDVSWKSVHYRIHFQCKGGTWRAFKITKLPPMAYYDKASTEAVNQMARTQLMANTMAQQMTNQQGGGGDNYANVPDNYANVVG